jgi:hypothetical protein
MINSGATPTTTEKEREKQKNHVFFHPLLTLGKIFVTDIVIRISGSKNKIISYAMGCKMVQVVFYLKVSGL